VERTENIEEIYNLLSAGKKIKLDFSSQKEADLFRVRIAQFKSRQEKMLVGLGVLETNDRQTFSFSVQQLLSLNDAEAGDLLPLELAKQEVPVSVTMQFKNKEPSRLYKIEILDDDEQDQEL
jgi:hypothetical protein